MSGKVILQGIECTHSDISTLQWDELFARSIERRIADVQSSAKSGDRGKAVADARELWRSLAAVKWLSENMDSERVPVYVAGSLFLHQCYCYLMRYRSEAIHFVSGPETDGNFYLTRLLPVRMSHRSWGRAVGDDAHTHQVLQELDKFGYRLTAYFHTHPGRGSEATHPSSIDQAMQRGLERNDYPTIGAIFSRDGYVRFFSCDRKFTVKVYGKKIMKESENVFKLLA
jgi:hypothetical protein